MKNNAVLKTIIAVLFMAIICSSSAASVFASDIIETETGVVGLISEDSLFSDDKIIVVLNKEKSLDFNSYSINDFSDIGCKKVDELTASFSKIVKSTVDSIATAVINGQQPIIDSSIDYSYYYQILCLELNVPGIKNLCTAIEKINRMDGVLAALPNYRLTLDSTNTNESSENFTDPSELYSKIGLDSVWANMIPGKTVRVAVVDTGIDDEHAALRNKVDWSTSADFHSFFVENEDELDEEIEKVKGKHNDQRGHGTLVAGIIAGSYDDTTGTRGVCSTVELVSIRIADERGVGQLVDLVYAMDYIRTLSGDDAIPIVNISAGIEDYYYEEENQSDLAQAILGYNGLVVCSAGNKGQNINAVNRFPTTVDSENIIVVGSSNLSDNKSSFSNYGTNVVDLFAPGENIVSCMPVEICPDWCNDPLFGEAMGEHYEDGYHSCPGTSFSAPFVTGVAALLLSLNDFSSIEIKQIILDSADEINSLKAYCEDGRRLEAFEAVKPYIDHSSHGSFYTSNATSHTFRCNQCDYVAQETHDLYMYSEALENYVVKCEICLYSITCNEDPEYYGTNASGHSVSCPGGCYSFFEEHSYTISYDTNGLGYHYLTCTDCGYVGLEAHDWVYSSSKYRCLICGMTSTVRPPSVVEGVIPEVDEIVASLPPVNDEEDLTE